MTESTGSTLNSPAAGIPPVMDFSGAAITPCEVCGSEDGTIFRILLNGDVHVFDSFECAIHALAQVCEHCGCRIVGHGIDVDGDPYCCIYCAEQVSGLRIVLEQSAAQGVAT